ncbi:hypothetical protein C4K88_11590 [Arthrobacter pityocampae]|uniref:Uncharacterized protein n=1 Tax=Arthrobacter pityocampae TaxID=547334 RepID=A0A2S5IUZ5_9MICC|nr:hypothetical protein [Arthrobacter pityocampae]PPB48393.1 hypothetical protein C4K88_11590 [Arthrobacter pityocampae]
MEFPDQNEYELVSQHSGIGSLEDVRTTLAEDVIQFLAFTPATSIDPVAPRLGQPGHASGQRQLLLRAAIVDLEAMDELLRAARSAHH